MSDSNTCRWTRRTDTGGTTTSNSISAASETWLRLVRSGTTITASQSADGTNWTEVGSTANTSFATTCYIGLAVSSGSDTTLNTSQFSNLSVTP
jgi:regulation of enolase protein 1 (concanavalin A-like superfamily)